MNRLFAIPGQYHSTRRAVRRGSGSSGRHMRTLRRIQGQIGAVSLGHTPAAMISLILGAYLSLQIVSPMFG